MVERSIMNQKGNIEMLALVVVVLCLLGGLLFGLPIWNVWKSGLSGEAKLKRAQQEKLIMIEQAKAEVEASKHRAQAIQVVGQAAKEFPEYRYQEFLGAFAEALQEGRIHQIIYVPTEANIPIMEAGKR
tara:strand:- start:1232 stop:1618 length:387 start_codon:yes stop_codon:yes gene_type:complete